jgi:hypothetical protein
MTPVLIDEDDRRGGAEQPEHRTHAPRVADIAAWHGAPILSMHGTLWCVATWWDFDVRFRLDRFGFYRKGAGSWQFVGCSAGISRLVLPYFLSYNTIHYTSRTRSQSLLIGNHHSLSARHVRAAPHLQAFFFLRKI